MSEAQKATPKAEITTYTMAEWQAEGARRFGPDTMKWKFVCPICNNVAAVEDFKRFKDQGADPNSATCECIGRYMGATGSFDAIKHKPCNYAGYGLFRLSPVHVVAYDGAVRHSFAFAEAA